MGKKKKTTHDDYLWRYVLSDSFNAPPESYKRSQWFQSEEAAVQAAQREDPDPFTMISYERKPKDESQADASNHEGR